MALEPIFDDQAGNVIALYDNKLVIQTRTVHLTVPALQVADAFLKHRGWAPPFGVLAVVNGDAGVLPEAVRDLQRDFVSRLLAAGAHMATVVYGDTVHASTMRSMGRMMLLRQPRLAHFTDLRAAAVHLAGPLGLTIDGIVEAVGTVQPSLRPF